MTAKLKTGLGIVLITCMLLSCKKETYKTRYDELLPRNNGTVSGLLNGKEWKSNICRAQYYKGVENSDTIDITASIFVDGYERQNIFISMLDLSTSIQKMESNIEYDSINQRYYTTDMKGCSSAFFPVDVDVPENVYWLYEDNNTMNQIVIEAYNKSTKQIKGSFEAHYTRFHRDSPPTQGLPDTLHFTNGKFEFQLK